MAEDGVVNHAELGFNAFEVISRKLRTANWAARQLRHHGRPGFIVMNGAGIGDDLLCTAVCREICLRGVSRVWMMSIHPDLFRYNPFVKVLVTPDPRWKRIAQIVRAKWVEARYTCAAVERSRDIPSKEHVIACMCRAAGVHGKIHLRPYLFLTPAERTGGKIVKNQIAIQSSGQAARFFQRTKQWFPDRFQRVVDELSGDFNFIQVGSINDPQLLGATDLRGKTTVRETAAILARSKMFVGLEGFLMHLARAVETPSVIVLGGRTLPWQFGYSCNETLATKIECANCWIWNDCDRDVECMKRIQPQDVIAAIQRINLRVGEPLAEDIACLK